VRLAIGAIGIAPEALIGADIDGRDGWIVEGIAKELRIKMITTEMLLTRTNVE
jgi:hypothetical protein